MNKVILIGRLTANPELKTTQSGLSVTSFSIAVNRPFKSQEGENNVDFINCTAWRQTAEFVCKYFQKGKMIALVGTLQTRKYQDKDGNNRIATDVVVENVEFCGSKQDGSTNNQPDINVAPSTFETGSQVEFTEVTLDDDLPF